MAILFSVHPFIPQQGNSICTMIILGDKHLLAKLSGCTSSQVFKPQLVSKAWYVQHIHDFLDINQWMCISL